MNVRKVTVQQVTEAAGHALDLQGAAAWPTEILTAVAQFLQVEVGQLTVSGRRDLTALTKTPTELRETQRPILRDGIHFYNYYTMAAPPGAVAPVVLDILCPADRIPQLNNGHLEPAITVNLGPGDIHGRWGAALSDATWQVMQANRNDDSWIVGDSYVEPSYCPHSYSLSTDRPARIISYTSHSNLSGLIEDINDWSNSAADHLLGRLEAGLTPGVLAEMLLARRGHNLITAAEAVGRPLDEISNALDGGASDVLRELGCAFGFDYRLLLAADLRHDSVGKIYRTVEECRLDAHIFEGYRVASLASASHLPDLTGTFMQVDADAGGEICELSETHYLVTDGELDLEWTCATGTRERARLRADGTAWVAPFVAHRWSGHGSLVKLGSGRHVSYLDLTELTNTYAASAVLNRGRRNIGGWGYDPPVEDPRDKYEEQGNRDGADD